MSSQSKSSQERRAGGPKRRPGARATDGEGDGTQRYRRLFDGATQFMAMLDPDGTIEEANRAFLAYLDLDTLAAGTTKLWDLPGWDREAGTRDRLYRCVSEAAAGRTAQDEIRIAGPDAAWRAVELSIAPVRNGTMPATTLILEARDATESKSRSATLIQAQKLEAIGQLTTGIAHDFNNLLTAIAGNLELVERKLDDRPSELTRIRKAIVAAFQGRVLTQQLLAFSRRQELRAQAVDLNALLGGMGKILDSLGPGMTTTLDLQDGLWPTTIDPSQFETVMLHIALNARDAMPEGGTIRITTRNLKIERARHHEGGGALAPGDYVCIAIADDGPGIPNEAMERIFEPFFTTKPPGKGSGLGLSMAYGFAKQSGGDIDVSSGPDGGTTVQLYFGRADPPPAAAPVVRDRNRPVRVLLVEDEDDVRDVSRSVLRDLGCDVTEARSGDEAVTLLCAGATFDLLFTDIVMPGQNDGLAVAAVARELSPEIAILFTSGFPRQWRKEGIPDFSTAPFIAKPFRYDDLADQLRAILFPATS